MRAMMSYAGRHDASDHGAYHNARLGESALREARAILAETEQGIAYSEPWGSAQHYTQDSPWGSLAEALAAFVAEGE